METDLVMGVANSEDLDEIILVLDSATKKLLNHKIDQWDYPWERALIEADIRYGLQYAVKSENRIIAVFSIKEDFSNPWEQYTDYNQSYLYRIAVHPSFQGMGVGAVICSWVKAYAESMKRRIYLDCWAGNEKLKAFYNKAGFFYLGDFPEKDYRISVFRTR